jgi:hypothetical protein
MRAVSPAESIAHEASKAAATCSRARVSSSVPVPMRAGRLLDQQRPDHLPVIGLRPRSDNATPATE